VVAQENEPVLKGRFGLELSDDRETLVDVGCGYWRMPRFSEELARCFGVARRILRRDDSLTAMWSRP
jgi:hypothetical protein